MIGGFIGLIWDLFGASMGGYQSFRFNSSLISEIYSTTDKSRMRSDNLPTDTEAAIDDLHQSIETKQRYMYFYREYLIASILKCLCSCCCKQKACYK